MFTVLLLSAFVDGGVGTVFFVSRRSPPGYCYSLSMFFHHFQKGIVSWQSQKSQDVLLIAEH